MYCRTILSAVVITIAAACTLPVQAGPPDGSKISAKADWVFHLDVAALTSSKLGSYILENNEDVHLNLDEFDHIEEELGIDPFKVVREVTMYGDDEEHMVALLYTSNEIDDVLARLEEQEDSSLTKFTEGDAEIYSVDDGELLFHVIHSGSDNRLVVLSDDAEELAVGIAAAYGRGERLGDRLDVEAVDGGILYIEATSIPKSDAGDNPASMIIQKATAYSARLWEHGDDAVLEMRIEAGNSEDAKNIADVVGGLLAMGKMVLSSTDEPEAKQVAELLQGIEITPDGAALKCTIRQSVETTLKALRSASEEE